MAIHPKVALWTHVKVASEAGLQFKHGLSGNPSVMASLQSWFVLPCINYFTCGHMFVCFCTCVCVRAWHCYTVVLFTTIMTSKCKQLFPCILWCLALRSVGEIAQRFVKCCAGTLHYLVLNGFTVIGAGLLLFYNASLFYMQIKRCLMLMVHTWCRRT